MAFDFDTDPFTKSPLVEHVAKEKALFFLRNKNLILANKQPIESKLDEYVNSINDVLDEIIRTIDDLGLIRIYIIDLISPNHEYFDNGNIGQHVRYHIENYIIRVYKIKDQMLSLIKTIVRLEVTNMMRLEKEVLAYLKKNQMKILDYWHHVDSLFDSIRQIRNSLAHRHTLNYPDLKMIELAHQYSMLDAHDDEYIKELQNKILKKALTDLDIYLKNLDTLLKMTCVTLNNSYKDNCKELSV